MSMTIKKDNFFKTFLADQNITKSFKKQILNNFPKKDSIEIINENHILLTLNLELHLTADIFTLNFRENLVEYLKNKYENRAYYLFYLNSIDYTSIIESELPLIKRVGEYYILNLPVKAELIYFKKNDIVEMKLVLHSINNKINVYATNKYLSCKINLNTNQIIEINYLNNEAILNDKKSERIFKNNNKINIKLIEFFNNKLEEGFTPKINCAGEIINI